MTSKIPKPLDADVNALKSKVFGESVVTLGTTDKSGEWVKINTRSFKVVQVVHDYYSGNKHLWSVNVVVALNTIVVTGQQYINLGTLSNGAALNVRYTNNEFQVSIDGTNNGTIYVFGLD